MSVTSTGGGQATIECDDCGTTQSESNVTKLMQHAAQNHWKVFNAEDGVKHYCASCGKKPEHELALTLRNEIQMRVADRGSGDVTGMLDDIVMSAAESCAIDGIPDSDTANFMAEGSDDGGFSFDLGVDFDD